MGFITKFMPEAFIANPSFMTTSWTIDILSSTIEPIQSDSAISIDSINSNSISSSSISDSSISSSSNSIYVSDVYFQTNSLSYSYTEKNSMQITIEAPCSSSDSTSISFSRGDYNGVTAPSWANVNQATGSLSLITPEVSSDNQVDFYIYSNISGVSDLIPKLISVKVLNWNVDNCYRCAITSTSTWEACNSGYNLHNGGWIKPNKTAQSLKTTSQTILGSTTGVVAVFSLFNVSSISSLWSMMNQLQLFFLLFLTRAFIPLDVQTVITGSKVALNLPQYFEFQNVGFYNDALSHFNFNLSDSEYDLLDVQSESTIFNTWSSFALWLLIVCLHLLIYFLYKILSKIQEIKKWNKMLKIIKWIVNKIFSILTFGYYIRFLFEINQFVLISSIHEIYRYDSSQSLQILSISFAIFMLLGCIFLIIFIFYLSLSSYEVVEDNHNKLGEIFSGVKMQKKHKLYVVALLIRRALFVLLLVVLSSVSSQVLIGILVFIQVVYTVLISYIRPFSETKGNIIEIINEIYFLALLSSLIYLNSENDWNNIRTNIYSWFLTSNTIVIFFIIFGKIKF